MKVSAPYLFVELFSSLCDVIFAGWTHPVFAWYSTILIFVKVNQPWTELTVCLFVFLYRLCLVPKFLNINFFEVSHRKFAFRSEKIFSLLPFTLLLLLLTILLSRYIFRISQSYCSKHHLFGGNKNSIVSNFTGSPLHLWFWNCQKKFAIIYHISKRVL